MQPYYEHKGIVIYHADSRDVLPDLPGADAIITDPVWTNAPTGIYAEDEQVRADMAWVNAGGWLDEEKLQRLERHGMWVR